MMYDLRTKLAWAEACLRVPTEAARFGETFSVTELQAWFPVCFAGRAEEAGGDRPARPARALRPAGAGVRVALFRCFSDGPRLHLV